jgi:hypothetical protein
MLSGKQAADLAVASGGEPVEGEAKAQCSYTHAVGEMAASSSSSKRQEKIAKEKVQSFVPIVRFRTGIVGVFPVLFHSSYSM